MGAKDWLAGAKRAMCVSGPFWDVPGLYKEES